MAVFSAFIYSSFVSTTFPITSYIPSNLLLDKILFTLCGILDEESISSFKLFILCSVPIIDFSVLEYSFCR